MWESQMRITAGRCGMWFVVLIVALTKLTGALPVEILAEILGSEAAG
jgi:hypothetical protein